MRFQKAKIRLWLTLFCFVAAAGSVLLAQQVIQRGSLGRPAMVLHTAVKKANDLITHQLKIYDAQQQSRR